MLSSKLMSTQSSHAGYVVSTPDSSDCASRLTGMQGHPHSLAHAFANSSQPKHEPVHSLLRLRRTSQSISECVWVSLLLACIPVALEAQSKPSLRL